MQLQSVIDGLGGAETIKTSTLKAVLALTMISLSVLGSYSYKRAAEITEWTPLFFSLGSAAWLLSATCFVALLKTGNLGIWGPMTAVIQVALVMVVSTMALNESYSAGQWAATTIAIVAMGVSLALST